MGLIHGGLRQHSQQIFHLVYTYFTEVVHNP